MFRLLSTLLLCLALISGSPAAAAWQGEKTTTWKGTLDAGGTKLRLEIDITPDGQGSYQGQLRSLDQGNAALKLSEVRLDPATLSFSVSQIGASFSGKLSEDGSVAEGTFSQSGVTLPLTLTKGDPAAAGPAPRRDETLREAWVGKLQMGPIEPVMQFRIMTTETGDTLAYFDSITEGRRGFTAQWSIEENTLRFDVPGIRLTYRGTLNQARDMAEGTWTQGGRDLPLTLTRQLTEYDDQNTWENRPQRPLPPFPYEEQEVTFENAADGVKLAGTLTLPRGPGAHPAVILISGSGAQDRDESLMGHKPFLVLADYLTRRGVAVLRYDDRGTAGSTGNYATATVEDFARDASAAIDFLAAQERIDPSRIGLAGHSEGGLVAPMVATQRDDVAFLVLLAATGVDGATVIQSQSAALRRADGGDEAAIEVVNAVNRAVFEVVLASEPGTDLSPALERAVDAVLQTVPEERREATATRVWASINAQKSRLQSKWLRFFLSYDPRHALRKVACPVLAIAGSRDLQVLPELNLPEIEKALEQGGNPDFEVAELPGLNHLFQRAETGTISEYVQIQETLNPAALEKIGDWIVQRTSR